MKGPVYLYVLGRDDGPFKVGYSRNPKKRADYIRRCRSASVLGGGSAAIRHLTPVTTEDAAKAAEQTIHAAFAKHRVCVGSRGRRFRTERFATDLARTVEAVERAVDARRRQHEDLPTRAEATRRLIELGLKAENAKLKDGA